jgi:hypothetical protein
VTPRSCASRLMRSRSSAPTLIVVAVIRSCREVYQRVCLSYAAIWPNRDATLPEPVNQKWPGPARPWAGSIQCETSCGRAGASPSNAAGTRPFPHWLNEPGVDLPPGGPARAVSGIFQIAPPGVRRARQDSVAACPGRGFHAVAAFEACVFPWPEMGKSPRCASWRGKGEAVGRKYHGRPPAGGQRLNRNSTTR